MLTIQNLTKTYSINSQIVEVFKNLNLTIGAGEIVALWGPNGCGKTSLLKIIAGLTAYDEGTLEINRKPIHSMKKSFVFQEYQNSLLPWLRIKENITLPLVSQNISTLLKNEKVYSLCKAFGYSVDLQKFPYELSGGQQQFASLLRGLITQPDIYLLDEPFSSLDYHTRISLLEKFYGMWKKMHITVLFTSHDLDEIIFLSQKIILMNRHTNGSSKIRCTLINPLPQPRTSASWKNQNFFNLKKKILTLYEKSD